MKYSSCNRTILIIVLLVSVVFMGTFRPSNAPWAAPVNPASTNEARMTKNFVPADTELTTTASDGKFVGTGEIGDWTKTQDKDYDWWRGDAASILYLNFTITWSTYKFDWAFFGYYDGISGTREIQVYDVVTLGWEFLSAVGNSQNWFNGTDETDLTWVDNDNHLIRVRFYTTGTREPNWDYVEITSYGSDTRTAKSGEFTGTGEVNSWVSTTLKDGTDWYGDVSCTLTLTFPIRNDTWSFDYHIYAFKEGVISGYTALEVYNFVSTQWVDLHEITESPTWYNGTIEITDYLDTTNNEVKLRLDSDFLYYPRWDYADITIYYGPHPEWQINNILEFFFPVKITPDQQFGYDAFFIFLGLIMIPASTMYLVRGGRKGMSADKFFYGMIIFALGIGFLIGGILP